ncbi:MAG: RagB/SusD family nutrient uptake outer membrane protein [Bacteroidales bacterium]|nr:RagB/SusD family nutrient uptake outer membrane protein [Bacteroidales bacterium]
MLDNFGDNFHLNYENGYESLFEIQWGDLTTTSMWGGGGGATNFKEYVGGPGMGRGNVNIPSEVFNEEHGSFYTKFEPYDVRKIESRFSDESDSILINGEKVYIRDSIMRGNTWVPYDRGTKCIYTPKKYINKMFVKTLGPSVSSENTIITRVAEVYFLYAEALIEGNGDLSVAREYLNKIRRRAFGFNENEASPYDITYATADELRTHLRADKRKEFIGEMIRWNDMIRWDGTHGYSIAEECEITGRIFSSIAVVWPIPLNEAQTNLLVEQYPGY